MKRAAALSLGVLFLGAPITVQAQQQPQQEQQQPEQQQQAQQQQKKQLKQARLEGKVKQVGQQELTLSVAGSELSLQAQEQDLQGVQQDDIVQVTAVPLPEAQQVTQMQQATPEQRQKAQSQEDPKMMSGQIQEVQENVVTVRTQQGETQHLKVKEDTAGMLQPGGEYIIQLSSAPDEAESWMAESISKQ